MRTFASFLYAWLVFINILNYLGVFAFAVGGSYKAIEKRFDLAGIYLCGFATAFGGGTIRQMILHQPLAYFVHPWLLGLVAAGVAFAIFAYKNEKMFRPYITFLDTVGLVAFSLAGCRKAAAAGLGYAGMAAFAFLTAAGGGILTDLLTGGKARFRGEAYGVLAILFACEYWLAGVRAERPLVLGVLLGNVFLLRLIAVRYQIQLWRPYLRRRRANRFVLSSPLTEEAESV